jgi:hypothetical protein
MYALTQEEILYRQLVRDGKDGEVKKVATWQVGDPKPKVEEYPERDFLGEYKKRYKNRFCKYYNLPVWEVVHRDKCQHVIEMNCEECPDLQVEEGVTRL